MSLPIAIIDAFTSAPFKKGNPAAVCLMEQQPEENWMQQVAEEMNLSETAFLLPREDGKLSHSAGLRQRMRLSYADMRRLQAPIICGRMAMYIEVKRCSSIREADY